MNDEPKSLVLVVGAGASREVGLPLGDELRGRIVGALDIRFERGRALKSGDADVSEALGHVARERKMDANTIFRAARRVADALSLAISIDNALDAHRADELAVVAGKLAIAKCILKAEQESTLCTSVRSGSAHLDFNQLRLTWYTGFFQRLTEGCQPSDLSARFKRVSIVSFNYDRCIEHLLRHALVRYYGIKPEEAMEKLEHLEVLHPYGSVGSLDLRPYGADSESSTLRSAAGDIRTFTEGADPDTGAVERIRTLTMSCARLAFLGFGFHAQNLDLLFGRPMGEVVLRHDHSIFATGLGISEPDAEVLRTRLRVTAGVIQAQIHIAHEKRCADLFSFYRASLGLM